MNVVVIVVENLHLGYLGCYGNPWVRTPHIDELASLGVVFDACVTHTADCRAVRESWWSGQFRFPSTASAASGAGAAMPLVQRLHAAGGECRVAVSAGRTDRLREFFEGAGAHIAEIPGDEGGVSGVPDVAMCGLAEIDPGRPRLLWVELHNLVPPRNVPAEFLNSLQKLQDFGDEGEPDELEGDDDDDIEPDYGAGLGDDADAPAGEQSPTGPEQDEYADAVAWADAQVGALLEAMRRHRMWDDWAVVLVSDHGEPRGSQRGDAAPEMLGEEVVHVPLIVRVPSCDCSIGRTPAIAQPPDLLPTLAELLKIELPEGLAGRSLMPAVRGETDVAREFAVAASGAWWAIRTPQWHFVAPMSESTGEPAGRLYAKPDDRWERNVVTSLYPDVAEQLERRLAATRSQFVSA